jgi:hypothetical protein
MDKLRSFKLVMNITRVIRIFYTKTIPIKRSKNYIWLIFLNTFHVAGYTGFLQLLNE